MSGPTEATAIGNLLMQLKADGEIENIEEGRKISFSSSEVFKYNSKDTDRWDEV